MGFESGILNNEASVFLDVKLAWNRRTGGKRVSNVENENLIINRAIPCSDTKLQITSHECLTPLSRTIKNSGWEESGGEDGL